MHRDHSKAKRPSYKQIICIPTDFSALGKGLIWANRLLIQNAAITVYLITYLPLSLVFSLLNINISHCDE